MRFACLALCLLLAPPARGEELLAAVLKRLAEPAVVRAEFVQERFVADIARPALSRGRLTVSRRDGVLWRVEAPIELSLAFTRSEIIETGADGVRRLRSPRGGAVDTQVGRVMRGILGADAETLQSSFEATAEGSAERWTLRLVPRPREMARVLKEIRLAGGRHLETLDIEETSGNRTAIRMRNVRVGDELDADEREQFKAP